METTEMSTKLSMESCYHENDLQIKKMCIDEMFQKYCGEFGRWQLKHFILTNLTWILAAFHSMILIFAEREPNWRCLPGSAGSGCNAAADSVCELKPGSWEWVEGRDSSTVSEWGLFCGQKFKVGLVHSLFYFGSTIGAGVFGHLSDSFLGRKYSLGLACALNATFGCFTALTQNYWTYLLLRLLTGFSNAGTSICAYVLATEPIGSKKRGSAGMCTFYFFSGGIALLSGIAYIIKAWRYLYIASSIPSFLYIFLILPFLSESPRWYLIRGKVNEATKLMSAIASSNGKHLPNGIIPALDEEVSAEAKGSNNECLEVNKGAHVGTIMDVIRFPLTRVRLLLTVAINFLSCFVYYGLTFNVVNLKMNLYLNVMLNSVGEMPAFLITGVLINRLGRKPLTIGTMWFSGLFCLTGSLVRDVNGMWRVVRMVCGVLGIFGMAGTYNLMYIYTTELFPTVVRNAALGCNGQAIQMGAIVVPFLVVMGGWLPFAVFAACGIIGGILACFLPETLGQPLYDTFNGMQAGIASC